ncbi:TetR family transcriptional regulator [Mesorhizobium muleiense]|uniref:TetR/AcrR family transcriptional regulator n=1 Tax=Mesorhizobium muleiense TaxID=1004279 RepID=UPI001F341D97|nr:TetR family transcriptional regulator [Mesorhizobium muleiense]MCF6115754.1 TetR family transcriptional regulator [Mesorhizobium muleiense]
MIDTGLVQHDGQRHAGRAGANDQDFRGFGQHLSLHLSTIVDFLDEAIAFVNGCWHKHFMTENQPKKPGKSDRTRAKILEAAKLLFAEHGYEGASIRDVAAHASIDPAMVIRYFRSKDELFARAAVVDLQLPALRVIDRNAIGETLIRRFLEVWEGPASGPGMAILLRSATSNEFAAEKLRDVFGNQVRPVIAAVADPADAGPRAGLVSSQLLGLAMCRYLLRLPPVVALSHDEIIQNVGPTLQRYAVGEA